MFDFNTRPLAAGAIATAAVFGVAQGAQAASVQRNLTNGMASTNSDTKAVYTDTFAAVSNATSVTFNADSAESQIFTKLGTSNLGDAAVALSTVDLQLDGSWVNVDKFSLSSADGSVVSVSILGASYGGFGPAVLTGVRLTIQPNITSGTDVDASWTVSGSPAYLTIQTVPVPAAVWSGLGLLGILGGMQIVRRRRPVGSG